MSLETVKRTPLPKYTPFGAKKLLDQRKFTEFFEDGFEFKLFDNVPHLRWDLVVWNKKNKGDGALSFSFHYWDIPDVIFRKLRALSSTKKIDLNELTKQRQNVLVRELSFRFSKAEPIEQKHIDLDQALQLLSNRYNYHLFDDVMHMQYLVVFWKRGDVKPIRLQQNATDKLPCAYIFKVHYEDIDGKKPAKNLGKKISAGATKNIPLLLKRLKKYHEDDSMVDREAGTKIEVWK